MSIQIIPFNGEIEKWRTWLGKLLAMAGQLGYNVMLRGTMKTPADIVEKKTKEDAILKQLNKNTHNGLILVQYDKVCLQIVE